MDATGRSTRIRSHAGVLEAVADRRRRRLLELLVARTDPTSEERLATRLAAAETGRDPDDVSASAVESRHVDVSHVHLPALEDVGLVDHDRAAGTVAATDHPAIDDPAFERIVETDAAGWDAVLACLADARRRTVLTVLVREDGPVARPDLVRAVAAREPGSSGPGDAAQVEHLRSVLYHVHLPALEDAGLIEHDAGTGVVTYEGHPALEREWLDVDPGDTPRPILPSARRVGDVWRLEGRAHATERRRALCDDADEELVVLLATEGLLEAACIRRLRNAVERSVDVCVGTPSPAVRERLSEEVPGATLWEPRFAWPDVPTAGATAGWLVMADRSAIAFGALGGSGDGEGGAETAITSTGASNGMVVWLRALLGSRLDHLDDRGEDVRTGISL